MPAVATLKVIESLRRTVLQRDGGGLTDGQLLSRFIDSRDEAAFEVLVHRHGPMVMGVCGRILNHRQDAEDAFQAVFLVLARKATAIEPREMVGNWLYGVAYQTALKARAAAVRRRLRECQVSEMPEPSVAPRDDWNDLRPMLDRELNRLPDKYRVPIVLCDLEGKGHKEAADQLGWPQGTLSGRLSRAREMLAKRLRGRGLAIAAGPLIGLLTDRAASASVSFASVELTTKTATQVAAGQAATTVATAEVVALMEGVMKTMLLTKLKMGVMALLFVLVAGYGANVFYRDAVAGALRIDQVAALAPERGGPAAARDGTDVRGILKSSDAIKKTITIAIGGGREQAAEEKTYGLSKDVEVATGDKSGRRGFLKEAKLADLPAGTRVALGLSADKMTAETVLAEGPTIQGHVKSVDATNKTITLTQSGGRGEEGVADKTYTVSVDAEIAIDDGRGRRFSVKEGKLADIAVGAIATLFLTADQKLVQSLVAEGATFQGVLKSQDVGKNTLTIAGALGRGGDGAEAKTLELAKDAVVLIDDGKGKLLSVKQGKLGDFPAGSAVTGKMAADQQNVTQLHAEGPTLSGSVKAVDPAKDTIILNIFVARDQNPEERTISVAKDAKILVEGNVSKLGDIKVDENTHAQVRLTLDQKTAQSIVIGSGRR